MRRWCGGRQPWRGHGRAGRPAADAQVRAAAGGLRGARGERRRPAVPDQRAGRRRHGLATRARGTHRERARREDPRPRAALCRHRLRLLARHQPRVRRGRRGRRPAVRARRARRGAPAGARGPLRGAAAALRARRPAAGRRDRRGARPGAGARRAGRGQAAARLLPGARRGGPAGLGGSARSARRTAGAGRPHPRGAAPPGAARRVRAAGFGRRAVLFFPRPPAPRPADTARAGRSRECRRGCDQRRCRGQAATAARDREVVSALGHAQVGCSHPSRSRHHRPPHRPPPLGRVLEVAPSAHRAGPAASGACDRKAEGRPRSGPARTTPTTQRACVPGVAGQAGLPKHGLAREPPGTPALVIATCGELAPFGGWVIGRAVPRVPEKRSLSCAEGAA
ncbi:hypothetical protein SBRY_60234 [Actinacidiphila bryophytorum]|uniref:Uncharacterized protein n=1 Tax=Actinacidiphila bryophytorum TaxID=1436133 RepID=A0A9W4MK35_9ACTN|nr:hypothetical protein SBRY_60234 [Actinacidiphila bryophytorum]